MDPVLALVRLGGVARRKTLLDCGVTRRAIDAAVRSGDVRRPITGVLSLSSTPTEAEYACYFGARITCVSAADALDLRLWDSPAHLHLEIPAARGGTTVPSAVRAPVRMHRSRTYRPGSRVVTAARAIDVMSRCVTPLAQLVTLDHALSRGILTKDHIAGFTMTDLVTRRWLEHMADDAAGSVPETCARVAMRAAGLTVESQAPLGQRRRADFLVEGLLYVEIDGKTYHSDERQFAEDRARDRAIVAAGRNVIRFTYADAVHHPERLVADVKAALTAIRGR